MSIARMSMIDNSYRYFTITIDRYEEQCMEGVIYHAGKTPGIRYTGLLELVLQMNRIFDQMSCPKQTVEFRRFSDAGYPSPPIKEYSKLRKGKIATFRIYVKYRYNATWQGVLTWLEEERSEHFESLLQMIRLADGILEGQSRSEEFGRVASTCQIAVNSNERGLIAGSVQNAFINHIEDFKGTIGLADAMVHLFEVGIVDSDSRQIPGEGKIISEETWNAYRKGGKKATFVVKILYREHSTWQGKICWRETGESKAFRSFLEMIILMASALKIGDGEIECEDRYSNNRQKNQVEG